MTKYLLTLAFAISILFANDDITLENDFLQSLDEVSELATKTKLNIDDTPSFITILNNQKLEKLGIINVFEALELVPGIQLKREESGVPVIIFRGVSQKGEVKLMVDGVTINNTYRGSIYYYLNFPIEMVNRIEVIRGAGSVLYGSGAMSGVINIITKSSQLDSKKSLFISTATQDQHMGGALFSSNIKDIKIALDAYYQKSNKTIFVEPTNISLGKDSDRSLKDYSVGFNISNENLELLARIKKSDTGNAYGILGSIDDEKDKFYNKNRSIFTQLSYKNNIDEDNNFKILAGYNNYEQIAEVAHPSGIAIDANYKEQTYFYEANFFSTSLQNNQLLLGARFEDSKTLQSEWHTATKQLTPISDPNLVRKISSLYLNDIYSIVSDIDISVGARYDHYSDFGDAVSPNLGVVYRATDRIRLKAQYSHAYRAPSWIELTSNSSLKAEISNSLEAGIIYKQNNQNSIRINFYTTKIRDMITKPARKYIQDSQNKFLGSEIEYNYIPNEQLEINFLASYVQAKDAQGEKLPDVANILASSSLIYELDSGIIFGSLLKYISSSKRGKFDLRNDMKDSLIFDQTISYSYKDFTTSLILKDLFDANTYYALSPIGNRDYDDGGRSVIIKASLDF